MKIYARVTPWSDSVDLFICDESDSVKRSVAVSFEIGKPIEQGLIMSPSWSLDSRDAQMFLDALWEAGLRPHDGNGSGAQVEALKANLADLRRIVFKDQA